MTSLVFVTQLIDPVDPALGFVCGSIAALAEEFDRVDVIANEVRCTPAFPRSVEVHTLGKETGAGRAERGWRYERTLNALLAEGRHRAVLAHMCPDYLTLAAPVAKARRARTLLWFTHAADSWRLALAEHLADTVLTSLPESYPRKSSKVRAIGHGVDTSRFGLLAPAQRSDDELRLVAIGRLSDAKRYDLAIGAVEVARARGISAKLRIVGPATTDVERANEHRLNSSIRLQGLSDSVVTESAVQPSCVPAVLSGADALLNTTIDGSADKVVFEAMAAGRPVIVANRAMAGLITVRPDLAPASDVDTLADRIVTIARMNPGERSAVGRELRARVVADHSLEHWARAVAAICQEPR